MEKLLNAIDKMIEAMSQYKEGLLELTGGSLTSKIQSQPVPNIQNNDFETLKQILLSDQWPVALNKHLICDPNNEQDKKERARGIIDLMIEEDLNGKKFLDYGCGEGHVVTEAAADGAFAVGYDINSPNKNGFYKTLEEVASQGPYDVILMYDVLDHATEDPVVILKNAFNLLKEGGRLYLRCHPFMSRHATHLYNHFNKAFVHLVFTDDEIKNILGDKTGLKTTKITKPLATYGDWIRQSGFKNPEERIIKEQVEPFFKTPKIAERIMKNTGHSTFPEFQMQQVFVDYNLIKKS
jgi:2-polyprenyl-3-methyl-5-hydroxy-6-metoxy-1,4-benzoquinol methylase